jgi:Sec-independent protein translocase protein TatA
MALLGLNEIVLIGAAVIALVLGPKKLPELARAIGQSKQAYSESMQEADEAVDAAAPEAELEADHGQE